MTSTDNNKSVDVQAFIDRHPIARLQWLVVGLCFLVTAIDGLDTAAIGFIAPALREEWQVSAASLSPVLGAALVGLMLGAFAAGPLADRFGRKRILLYSVACFGMFSLLAAFSTDLKMLALFRLLTGLGLGGAMPNAITLTSEYCPQRKRSLMVTTMFCGFTLGSALGGLVAAQLVPMFGWRSVLLVGGVLPLCILPLLIWLLPESPRFLLLRHTNRERILKILARISTLPASWNGYFKNDHDKPDQFEKSPIRLLVSRPFRLGTFALWVSFFMSLLIIYMMTNWLPLLIKDTGLSLSHAAIVSAMFQIGGTVGAICLGGAMDKFEPHRVLIIAYVIGAACLYGIGHFYSNYSLLIICVAGMGFCISGSQVGANALAASYYPTASRATGVSWAHGVGRIGSVCGTIGGGFMFSFGMDIRHIFALLMIPALLAASAMFIKGTRAKNNISTASPALI